jgi:hypothetical protein
MLTDILICLVASIAVYCYGSLLQLPQLPKGRYASLGDAPSVSGGPIGASTELHQHERASAVQEARSRESRWLATWKAKHTAMRRIALGDYGPLEPGVIRLPVEDLVIVSMPVLLYESSSKSRHAIFRRRAAQLVTWNQPTDSGKTIRVAFRDRGILELTKERFIFKSAKQRREFPLGELTHFSATSTRLAIAARGRYGVSYFTGVESAEIRARIEPDAEDTWPAETISFNVQGQDISEIVEWLMPQPSPPEPA